MSKRLAEDSALQAAFIAAAEMNNATKKIRRVKRIKDHQEDFIFVQFRFNLTQRKRQHHLRANANGWTRYFCFIRLSNS